MGSAPLVDIVMPTYNHEKFIAQAIESVLAQETDFTYRLRIGDDCSTDDAPAIIRSYAERYPERIEACLYSPHVGAFDRERAGVRLLRQATAKYVALLEGDDYWTDPHKLQKQVDYLESHPGCAVCFHDAVMFYEDGSEPPRRVCAADQKEVSTLEDIVAANFLIPCTALFRNVLGELPDAFFKVRSADWFIFVLVAQHGSLDYINEVSAAYRIHNRGVWSSLNYIQRIREHIKMYETVDAYFNYKYHHIVAPKIAEQRARLAEQYRQRAISCLDEYNVVVRGGHWAKAFPLLAEATRSAPSEVLRPRRFAVAIRNGLVGAISRFRNRSAAGYGVNGE